MTRSCRKQGGTSSFRATQGRCIEYRCPSKQLPLLSVSCPTLLKRGVSLLFGAGSSGNECATYRETFFHEHTGSSKFEGAFCLELDLGERFLRGAVMERWNGLEEGLCCEYRVNIVGHFYFLSCRFV